MDGNIISNISLGCLNPVVAWLNWDADSKATDHLRKVAKDVERWHFYAGVALAVLADRIDLWRYDVVNIFTEDYARLADARWEQVIDSLAVIASSPWCVGLEFWEKTNLDDPDAITRVVPFNLKRLRNNPLDAESHRELRGIIMDMDDAQVVIKVMTTHNFPISAEDYQSQGRIAA